MALRPHSLKTRITVIMLLFSLGLVVLTSLLAHNTINRKFMEYIARQQQEKNGELLSRLRSQSYLDNGRWDLDFIHTVGMYALYDGYFITVTDGSGDEVWGALTHDMTMCYQVMSDIQQRMETKYPSVSGEFTTASYPLEQGGQPVGSVEISYYGPYFLSENDFDFLEALDAALVTIGLIGLILCILVGRYVAGRISRPILQAVSAAQGMVDGNYEVRLGDDTTIKELRQLTHSVNHLAASLGDQQRLRRQLTADVAHELRTPLTSVGTHLEAMMEGLWSPTPERLHSIHEETQRLTGLVRDLEQLARVENQSLCLQKTLVPCRDLVEHCVDQLALAIQQKGLRVETRGLEAVALADPDRMRQVIYNLLSNAVKYTPEGGQIHISAEEDAGWTHLAVGDTGIGISGEHLPHLFERFYRVDKSRSRTTGGSGIGLSIVKAIVSAHGGTIHVESQPGEGSLFRMSLPGA